jgi:hypothetical protein
MNKGNARYEGTKDGRAWQQNKLKLTGAIVSRQKYEETGRHIANMATSYVKTAELYCQGWNEAYIEPQLPAPSAPVPHDPNTRFCGCPSCMWGA